MPYRRHEYKYSHLATGILLRSNSLLAPSYKLRLALEWGLSLNGEKPQRGRCAFLYCNPCIHLSRYRIILVKRARQYDWYFRGHGWRTKFATVRCPFRRPSLGQHREGGSILSGSIGSTPEIELLSPIPALAQNTELGKPRTRSWASAFRRRGV